MLLLEWTHLAFGGSLAVIQLLAPGEAIQLVGAGCFAALEEAILRGPASVFGLVETKLLKSPAFLGSLTAWFTQASVPLSQQITASCMLHGNQLRLVQAHSVFGRKLPRQICQKRPGRSSQQLHCIWLSLCLTMAVSTEAAPNPRGSKACLPLTHQQRACHRTEVMPWLLPAAGLSHH